MVSGASGTEDSISAAAEQASDAILIVDDNAANLLALEAILAPLRQPVVRATSGAEALQRLVERKFRLVLMDVCMPLLDGFQTAEMIRSQESLRWLPIMFLTANDEASAQRGYSLGAIDFLTKPFEPEVLRAKVSALITLSQHNEWMARQGCRSAAEPSKQEVEAKLANMALTRNVRDSLCAILLRAQQLSREDASETCHQMGKSIERSVHRLEGYLNEWAPAGHVEQPG